MKKYFQIISALGVFGIMVLVRQHVGADNTTVLAPKTQNILVPTNTPIPTPTSSQAGSKASQKVLDIPTATPTPSGMYKDGTYTGGVADAFYGNIQVQAVITGGRLTDVVFLQYPNDNGTSISINTQASVYLKQEAIAAQSANVNIVSGASDSSIAFQQSLASALAQAK